MMLWRCQADKAAVGDSSAIAAFDCLDTPDPGVELVDHLWAKGLQVSKFYLFSAFPR